MVHHDVNTTYLNSINALEDYNTNGGYGNCDEAGSFIDWQNRSWDESDPITIGKSDNLVARYQERERHT